MNMRTEAEPGKFRPSELIEWLEYPHHSLYPERYAQYLPVGLVFISPAQGLNCADYAQGCKGKHWVDEDTLEPSTGIVGDLVLYFGERYWMHAGIVIEGQRVRSQWAGGAVFEHDLWQVPKGYGRRVKYFKLPPID